LGVLGDFTAADGTEAGHEVLPDIGRADRQAHYFAHHCFDPVARYFIGGYDDHGLHPCIDGAVRRSATGRAVRVASRHQARDDRRRARTPARKSTPRPGRGTAMTEHADFIVIGMGPGGEYLAGGLANAGHDVIAVEHRLVGGECPYYGCIPSKMMLRGAHVLAEGRRVSQLAGSAEVHPDLSPVAERIRSEATTDWDDTIAAERFTDTGGRLIRGTARLIAPRTVQVGISRSGRSAPSSSIPERTPLSRRSRASPRPPTGPTGMPCVPPRRPDPWWCSVADRSAWNWPRPSPGSARRYRSWRPPNGSSPVRSRMPAGCSPRPSRRTGSRCIPAHPPRRCAPTPTVSPCRWAPRTCTPNGCSWPPGAAPAWTVSGWKRWAWTPRRTPCRWMSTAGCAAPTGKSSRTCTPSAM